MQLQIVEPEPPCRNPDWFNPGIRMMHIDCMEYMATLPNKAFDLAICDPPYGIFSEKKKTGFIREYTTQSQANSWDEAPNQEYFDELIRVSKNQIIWGYQYFSDKLPSTTQVIIWDKMTGESYFADGEAAYCSIPGTLRIFRHQWAGCFKASERKKKSVHPNQKPEILYKWLLQKYAKPGNSILDTHGGSGSICVACHDLGYDLTWMELDADYYNAAVKRYEKHAAQQVLFTPKELIQNSEQLTLL